MASRALALLLAAGVAACTRGPASPTGLPVPTLSPSASPTLTPPNTATIAYVGSLPGPIEDDPGFRAAQLAVSEANAGAFGRLPVTVRLVTVQLRGDPVQALTGLDLVVADPTLVTAVGSAGSTVALAVAPVLNRAEVPFMTPATDPSLGTQNLGHVFRIAVDDNGVSAATAAYISRVVKPACVFLASDGSAFGHNLIAGVTAGLSRSGITTRPETPPTVTGANYSRVALRAGRSGCGVTFYGGAASLGGRLAGRLRRTGTIAVSVLGADSLGSDGFRPWPRAAGGSVVASAYDQPGRQEIQPQRQFIAAYESRYAAAPTPVAGETWDAFQMVFAALKVGKVTRNSIDGFVSALQSFPGVTKTYSYRRDSGGSLAPPTSVFLYQDRGGRWVPLGSIGQLLKL